MQINRLFRIWKMNIFIPRLTNYLPYIVLILAGLAAFTPAARADVNCSASTTYPPQSLSVNINVGATYAGNDMPIGSTIYRNSMSWNNFVGVHCDGPFSLVSQWTVSNEPSGPAVMMSGLAYGNGSGPVYPTNVSGVGVLVFASNQVFSSAYPFNLTPLTMPTAGDQGYGTSVDIVLVKTGPIATGSVVNSSSFPNIAWRIPAQSGYTGLPIRPLVITFTGSVQFVTSTCTTPDVNVSMGKYDINKAFTGVGSATPWVDSSITLQNCPSFSGYYANSGTGQSSTGSTTATGTNRNGNLFTVSLAPATSVNGNVIALDAGSNAATGVGLQLGYTPNNLSASPTTPQNIWANGATWNVTAPTDGRSAFKIPLAARYYQNNNTVTPGQANAKVVFNIDYK